MPRLISLLAFTLLLAACTSTDHSIVQSQNNAPADLPQPTESTATSSTPSTVKSNASQGNNPTDLLPATVSPVASSKPSAIAPLPKEQCQGTIPPPLKATLGNYRLAQPSDFVTPIQQLDQQKEKSPDFVYLYGNGRVTCSIFTADFNEDGQKDYALLLVNRKTPDSQFRLVLNQGNGKFKSAIVRDYKKPPEPIKELISTAMFFKPVGELGSAKRKYFEFEQGTPEWKAFIAKPAIELWFPPPLTIPVSSPPPHKIGSEYIQFQPLGSKDFDLNKSLGHTSEVFYFVENQLKTTVVSD